MSALIALRRAARTPQRLQPRAVARGTQRDRDQVADVGHSPMAQLGRHQSKLLVEEF
ncbi:MAG: hypothetical protein ACREV9_09065 [Burkholderiales bacterium]